MEKKKNEKCQKQETELLFKLYWVSICNFYHILMLQV